MSYNTTVEPIIVSSKDVITRGYRLDPSQYNADVERIIRHCKEHKIPLKSLEALGWVEEVFLPNRFNRNYTGDSVRGVPMLGTSSMLDMRLPNDIRVFTNSVKDFESLYVRDNDILISRSGTVGTSVLCGKTYEKYIASDDCFRVRAIEKYAGYIAAYLKTNFGLTLLAKDSHGKVIKHLKASNVLNLHIFVFDENVISTVNAKMLQSKEMFDKAREAYAEVERMLQTALGKYIPAIYPQGDLIPNVSLQSNRLDPHMYDPFTSFLNKQIKKSGNYKPLKELADVWGVARFKRYYVGEENGTGLYSSSDIVRAELNPSKYMSNTLNKKNIDTCTITKNTILIPCSGAYGGILGKGIMSNELLDGKSVSQHVLRITAKGDDHSFYYIGAFLCSNTFGYPLITATRFGKDIPELDANAIEQIPIPLLDKEVEDLIASKFQEAISLQVQGNKLEKEATELIIAGYEHL